MAKDNKEKEPKKLLTGEELEKVLSENPFLKNTRGQHKTRGAQTPAGSYEVIGVKVVEMDDERKTKWLAAVCKNLDTNEIVNASLSAIFMSPSSVEKLTYNDVVIEYSETSDDNARKVKIEYKCTATKPVTYVVPSFGTDDFTVFGANVLVNPELIVGRRFKYYGKAVRTYVSKRDYQNPVDNVYVRRGQDCATTVAIWSQL